MFTGVVYATAAAQLMKMIYVSRAHQATYTAKTDLASSLYHHYVPGQLTFLSTVTGRNAPQCTWLAGCELD